jgi:hypothetical protein
MIQKNLAVSTLEIDLERGTVWVNAPNCVLRISKLEFANSIEDFSFIDISGGKATMMERSNVKRDSTDSEELRAFLIEITNYIFHELKNNKNISDQQAFLERVKHNLKTFIEAEYK